MFNVLIDTSVWLDLAEDPKLSELLDPLITMRHAKMINLLIPRTVIEEFNKNRERIASNAERSLNSHFKVVKDAIQRVPGDKRRKNRAIKFLADVAHQAPIAGGMVGSTLSRIELIMGLYKPIEPSADVKLRASDRALSRLAPCHHSNKNPMGDAVIIEIYFDCVKKGKPGDRFAFVTHNTHDFSVPKGDQRNAHPDLAPGFSRIKSMYFISLGDCLRRLDAGLVRDEIWENKLPDEPVRSLTEIRSTMDELFDKVWYNRHKNLAWEIAHGKCKVVTKEEWDKHFEKKRGSYSQRHIIDDVWKMAQAAAKRKEQQYGKKNLGPWDNFEWGMLNGKLSAIRWMLGDEWDMLDT